MATHLARTCDATAGSGYSNKWTWSGWVKRAKLGAEQGIMGNQRSDNNTNSRFKLYFRSTDKLGWECKDSGGSDDSSFETNMLFKDTNAWYHITFIYDSDNSTATERIKCYVNGKDVRTELGGFSSDNQAGSGFGTLWSSSVVNYLGTSGNNSGIAMQFGGCMSHCHLTYGQRYEASTFGETDSDTGEWKIITQPSVTYGSQGYFLLKDNASVTDQSGEGNNFTATGTLTKSEDNPSNSFATFNINAGNHTMAAGSTFSNGNTTVACGGTVYNPFGSTIGVNKGKWYAEFKTLNEPGDGMIGIFAKLGASGNYLGSQQHQWSWYRTAGDVGVIKNNSSNIITGINGYTTNDIIGIALDCDNNKLYIHKNGTYITNGTGTGNPSSGTNGISITDPDDTDLGFYFMAAMDWGGSGRGNWSANFGNGYFGTTAVSSAGTNASGIGIFEYDVPTGYTALCTKGLNI